MAAVCGSAAVSDFNVVFLDSLEAALAPESWSTAGRVVGGGNDERVERPIGCCEMVRVVWNSFPEFPAMGGGLGVSGWGVKRLYIPLAASSDDKGS